MVLRKTVHGKTGGYLELLVVRSYRYNNQTLNALLDRITSLWERLAMPPNTKVVHIVAAPKWRYYNSTESMFGLCLRYFYAALEFAYHPAQWLAIFDADVIPTRHTALYELYCFLNSERAKYADIATRHIIVDWINLSQPTLDYCTKHERVGLVGIPTNSFSEGLWCINFRVISWLCSWVNLLPPQCKYITEMFFSTTTKQMQLVEFPPTLCEVAHPNEVRVINNLSPAFYHFSSGGYNAHTIVQLERIINSAQERLQGG